MSGKKKCRYNQPEFTTKKSKFDIFNGNVSNPGEFLFVYLLIGILCIAMLIAFSIWSTPKSYEDLQYANIQFTRYEIEDECLHLYEDGNEKYYNIPAYEATVTDPEGLLRLCEDRAVLYVGYENYPKADTPHFGLESIRDMTGTVYLTMEAIHEFRWGEAPGFYVAFGGITVVWFLFCIISIYVGRHPDQFSRRTIRLFFQDGYVRHYKKR